MLACTRTFEGFVFCVPIVIALILLSKRTFNRKARSLLLTAVPALLVLVAGLTFLAYYNARLTGNALEFPAPLPTELFQLLRLLLAETRAAAELFESAVRRIL